MTALAHTAPMPAELRQALTDAIDRLRRAQPLQVSARSVRRFERQRIVLSRHARQKMMALLRLASSGSSNLGAWALAQQLGFDPQSCRRLPIDDARQAPPGSIVVFEGETAAVKGFGERLYPADAQGTVRGIFAPA